MRPLASVLGLTVLGCAATLVRADIVPPVGTYTLNANLNTTGFHSNGDHKGVLYGNLTFDANSILVAAYITYFSETTSHEYTFDEVGTTEFDPNEHLQSTNIYEAGNHGNYYAFSISQGLIAGVRYNLTCGVDCDDDVVLQNPPNYADEAETVGTITAATPEPSTLALLGTGALGLVSAGRRRFRR